MITLQPNQTLLFDGDSMTALRSAPTLDQWPWLRITNNHRSWADIFSELLFAWRPDLHLSFRTAAVGGSTCRDLAERFDRTVIPIRPDWVFMTLASNDANQYEGHSVYSDGTHFSHLGAMIVAGTVLEACGVVRGRKPMQPQKSKIPGIFRKEPERL